MRNRPCKPGNDRPIDMSPLPLRLLTASKPTIQYHTISRGEERFEISGGGGDAGNDMHPFPFPPPPFRRTMAPYARVLGQHSSTHYPGGGGGAGEDGRENRGRTDGKRTNEAACSCTPLDPLLRGGRVGPPRAPFFAPTSNCQTVSVRQ